MSHKLTVVIIEDEKNICTFIETTLANHDYKAVSAYTGKEGISCIASLCPDVVLLDLGLPDIDGIDVIRSVREFSSVPILVISARSEENEKVAALALRESMMGKTVSVYGPLMKAFFLLSKILPHSLLLSIMEHL